MKLKGYPNCCGAGCLIGLYEFDTNDVIRRGDGAPEKKFATPEEALARMKEQIWLAKVNWMCHWGLLTAITNPIQEQQGIDKLLVLCGFEVKQTFENQSHRSILKLWTLDLNGITQEKLQAIKL